MTVEYPPANANEGKVADVSEKLASLPQPILPKPPRPFNVANYDEGEDAELKNKVKQVGASKSKHNDSIIVPTEEDIVDNDGVTLDPAISRERRTSGDEGEAVDSELGGNVEPSQSKDGESDEVLQGDVEPFNNELPVLEAHCKHKSKGDVVTATRVEPILPWWKQRRTKLFLSSVFVVFAVMAIALGVSMSSNGEPLVVVPTSIPSLSLRPSVHPSLPPTTAQLPTLTHVESLKIVADDGAVGDYFGNSVAVFGDTLVVGAYEDDNDNGEESGSAYVYYRVLQTKEWIFQQKLVPDDGAAGDNFGSSVALFGDTLVAGAYRDDDKGVKSGSAYVYYRDLQTKEWILQQKLVPDDGAEYDFFGSSVAIYGDTVVVGAYEDDDKGVKSGSVYIYHQDPETKEWILQQKLVPDDGAERDYFGESVAIYNDIIVVGAPLDDGDKEYNSGSSYIYCEDPDTKEWIMHQKLVPDDGATWDSFGDTVVIYGSTVVVGAQGDDDKGESGSAYIYHQHPETKEWILQQKLVPDDGAADDGFGWSVAVFGDTLVVGAYGDDDKGSDSGSAYIYHQDSETKEWILQQKLVADDGAHNDYFGSSVAIYNGTVVVGAYWDDDILIYS